MKLLQPESLSAALALLAEGGEGTVPLAGGTVLMSALRGRAERPAAWLALGRVPELHGFRKTSAGLELGAGLTLTELIESPALNDESYCLLRKALEQVGSWQIRNVATLGGAVATALPVSDTVTALLALRASVRLASASGTRELPLREFLRGPMRTLRRPDELLTAIVLPAEAGQWRLYYRKLGGRKAYAMPILNLASAMRLNGDTICRWQLCVGGATDQAVCVETAPAVGRSLTRALLEELTEQMIPALSARDSAVSAAYKRQVCANLLQELWEQAEEASL